MGTIPTVRLNDGRQMPMIAFGTYSRQIIPGQFYKAVREAIKIGYRHIDTASIYLNEEEVGQAINDSIKDGLVKREELWVTTKLWNDCHAKCEVIPALRASLQRLQLDYVDLYLVHWPVSIKDNIDQKIPLKETWSAMEEALLLGLTKTIGVSNFNEAQLQELFDNGKIRPAVNQIEVSLNLTQYPLVKFCQSADVCITAYTPLGLLSAARPEYVQFDHLNSSEVLNNVAQKHGKSKAQIALRYLLDRNIVVAPKSFTPSRILENFQIIDFKLSEEDIEQLDLLNKDFRLVDKFKGYSNYPFSKIS